MKHTKKILVVDDNETVLESLRILLDDEGFEVNVQDRIRGLEQKEGFISSHDLILLDVSFPDGDGRNFCRKIKSNDLLKDLPVVMMSANRELKNSALDSGAVRFIPKPFDFDQVVGEIRRLICCA
ncbi:response regulator [Bergeyella sp. RCAD1439]|uniref:response regulator n=1 Tax=Bergeyella anatis TaxID=3113737 RepID=UPI002E1888A5|nr:response regulator [Bergeyella sp. RCAD1439]